jgi:diketogulonate reductase-like aldo/keto reductase
MKDNNIRLSDGNDIPPIGLGLWKINDETTFNKMFESAISVGYRHFDCAQAYGNEQFLGKNWKRLGLERKDIFITTKIRVQNFAKKKRLESFEQSLNKLQTDYVDLLLIHFPGPPWLRKSQWQSLEEIKRLGKAKSIGVSNHSVKELQAIESYALEMPVVNQIEMHVFMQQRETREYCQRHNIAIEAYSPLAHGRVMNNPVIQAIADKHGKSYAQIMLRWCVDKGAIPLPKSVTPKRLKENFGIFEFKLDKQDLDQLDSLDQKMRTLWRSILSG